MTTPYLTTTVLAIAVLDLGAAVAAAQRAGDDAYAIVAEAGGTPEELYDAYHQTFVLSMWDAGWPVPCACDFCAALPA